MSKMWERADFWPVERAGVPTADDYARGLADGRRAAEAEYAGDREAIVQLAAGLEALQPPSPALLTELIVTAVERLVSDIVGAVPTDMALLNERATALAEMIAGESEAVLAVNPEDIPLIDRDRLSVRVISDGALARGTITARNGSVSAEDGVSSALSRFRASIAALGIAL